MLKKLSFAVGVLGVTVFVLYLLVEFKPVPKKRVNLAEPRLEILTTPAHLGEYALKINSQGIIKHKIRSTLSAQVSGKVTQIHENMRKGSRFKKGDLLIQIDPRDYQVEYELAKANWLKAKLAQNEEQARSQQALKDWKRLTTGKKPTDLLMRKPQQAAAEAELVSAKARLSKAELDLERTQIRAPFDGLVLNQNVDIAQIIGGGSEIATIAATDILEVELSVSSRWREFLMMQQKVILTRAGSDKAYIAKVVRNTGVIDENTRQIQLIVEWCPTSGNENQLMAGDYVEATIDARQLKQVFVIPRSALVDDNFVWVVRDERIQKQNINVLWKDKNNVVFNEGVVEGELVNTTPLGNVVSGTLVAVQDSSDNGSPSVVDKSVASHQSAAKYRGEL